MGRQRVAGNWGGGGTSCVTADHITIPHFLHDMGGFMVGRLMVQGFVVQALVFRL